MIELDKFIIEKRYVLTLTSENLDLFLLKKPINKDCVKPNGRFSNVNNIFEKFLNNLNFSQKESLCRHIIEVYADKNFELNINNINKIIYWISNSAFLTFASKDSLLINPLDIFCVYEKLYENNEYEELDYKNISDRILYFLSIKESDILNIFIKQGYEIKEINMSLNKKCQLVAIAYQIENKYISIILKSEEHVFCLNPYRIKELSYLNNKTIINNLWQAKYIPIIDYELIDEIVVNENLSNNLRTKIANITHSNHLYSRISTFYNYFSLDTIPLGEFLDMEKFIEKKEEENS